MIEELPIQARALVGVASSAAFIRRLRALAVPALARMFRPEEQTFVFRLRLTQSGLAAEGVSKRYTAISLIGLANEDETLVRTVFGEVDRQLVCDRLVREIGHCDNLGDVALILWAARASGYEDVQPVRKRLFELQPRERGYPVVDLAWALAALCWDQHPSCDALRDALSARLLQACAPHSGVFSHTLGEGPAGLRSHVACFADLVYPVHALAQYTKLTGDQSTLDAARRCADLFCRKQGTEGQWWWHYDLRTGDVIEPYPVYAVHQDAMAPMALFALEEMVGETYTSHIEKGLAWLARAPELGGGSLVDDDVPMIWRKVARREPGKVARTVQALISRLHPRLRAPGIDVVFPVGAVDYEDRPYHLGWLLYAWPSERIAKWETR